MGDYDDPGTLQCGRELHVLRSDYDTVRAAREAAEVQRDSAMTSSRMYAEQLSSALDRESALRSRCEGLVAALREMVELRAANQAGRLTDKHELAIVANARELLSAGDGT